MYPASVSPESIKKTKKSPLFVGNIRNILLSRKFCSCYSSSCLFLCVPVCLCVAYFLPYRAGKTDVSLASTPADTTCAVGLRAVLWEPTIGPRMRRRVRPRWLEDKQSRRDKYQADGRKDEMDSTRRVYGPRVSDVSCAELFRTVRNKPKQTDPNICLTIIKSHGLSVNTQHSPQLRLDMITIIVNPTQRDSPHFLK